jgi:prepilin-type N-terminal cleavage/methylation domain-containing protein
MRLPRATPSYDVAMTARGITLIELLISMAILLAIAAIAAPTLMSTFAERRFESVAETIEQQLLLARAHAQQTGRAVEVRYEPPRHRLVARYFSITESDGFDPASLASPAGASHEEARDRTGDGRRSAGSFVPDEADDELAIATTWAERSMSRSVTLSDRRPEGDGVYAGAMPGANGDGVAAMFDDSVIDADRAVGGLMRADDQPIRLAIFLPDGSAMMTRTVWLSDEDNRVMRMTVNPWTGTPRIERHAIALDGE